MEKRIQEDRDLAQAFEILEKKISRLSYLDSAEKPS